MASSSLRSLLAERQAAAVVLAQAGSTAGSRDVALKPRPYQIVACAIT
jgi:hypothetical protein